MSPFLTLIFLSTSCFYDIYGVSLETIKELDEYVAENGNSTVRKWALLVAGSDGWMNYRHQADICHAYQILHAHGIPDEQIVVMMADDIAYNSENPDKGIIINHPNGSDVYHGVPHDYVHKDVTPDNFRKILSGDKQAMQGIGSGKVIDSDSDDHIFIYFADHGAPGLVAFPHHEVLHAKQLNDTLISMWNVKRYGQMVIYIEACESGSMFNTSDLLLKQINIFATTAANATESSYACYLDKKLETYLGDVYSVNWMEDSDRENLHKETLEKQYQIVKKETNTSHVQQFGNRNISAMHISQYQGNKSAKPIIYPSVPKNAVDSRDVPIAILKYKIEKYRNDPQKRDQYANELDNLMSNRYLFDRQLQALTDEFTEVGKLSKGYSQLQSQSQWKCHEQLVKNFSKRCYSYSHHPYTMKSAKVFMNLCSSDVNIEDAKNLLIDFCSKIKKPLGYIL